MDKNHIEGMLDESFFHMLEEYAKIQGLTPDKAFKTHAPKFLEVDPSVRMREISDEISQIDFHLNLLKDFTNNFNRYELAISGQNWMYVNPDEMKRKQRIYGFLSHNYNYKTRRETVKQLTDKKACLEEEYRCAHSVVIANDRNSRGNIEYLKNLQKANVFYGVLATRLMEYAQAFPTSEFVVKNKIVKGITREQFDLILDEILALNGKQKPSVDGFYDEPGEQLSLF